MKHRKLIPINTGTHRRCCDHLLGAGFHAFTSEAEYLANECQHCRTYVIAPAIEEEETWHAAMEKHLQTQPELP